MWPSHRLAALIVLTASVAAQPAAAPGQTQAPESAVELPVGIPVETVNEEHSPIELNSASLGRGVDTMPVNPIVDFLAGVSPKPKTPLAPAGLRQIAQDIVAASDIAPRESGLAEAGGRCGHGGKALRSDAEWQVELESYRAAAAKKGCPERPGWTPEHRDSYCADFDLEKQFACARAAQDLVDYRTISKTSGADFLQSVGLIAECRGMDLDAARALYRDLTERYVAACVGRAVDGGPKGWDDSAWREVAATIGVLTNTRVSYPPCTAFLSGDMVVTARHCVARGHFVAEDLSGFVFTTLVGRSHQGFTAIRSVGAYTKDNQGLYDEKFPESDLVGLVLSDSPGEVLQFAEPVAGEPLVAIGLNQNLVNLASDFGEQASGVGPLALMSKDEGVACRVRYFTAAGCMIHGCQTDNATSGAPLLALRNGRPVVVGVQAGSVDTGSNETCRSNNHDLAGYIANFAVRADLLGHVP